MAKKRKTAEAPPPPEPEESSEEDPEEEEVDEVELENEEESEENSDSESESETESDEEEEEKQESKGGSLRKLLESFTKDQLIDFLEAAALKDPSIIDSVTQAAESDPIHRNLFVHHIDWDVTDDQVLSIFRKYGEVEECKIVADRLTGRNKGYGFVLFKTREGARKALRKPQKLIGNRVASCQLASTRHVPIYPFSDSTGRKIYVAKIGPHVNPERLRAFFSKFGDIEEGPVGLDPVTGNLKGSAIFVYKNVEGCKKALEEPVKLFEGCKLQCSQYVKGRRINKYQTGAPSGEGSAAAAAAAIQRNDMTYINYGVGVNPGIIGHGMNPGIVGHGMNPGMIGHSVNPAAILVGQNPGIGSANPVLASASSQMGFSPSVPTQLPSSIGATPSVGFSGNYGINRVSPSVIGSYGSLAALQGLGAYQSAQLGHSSARPTATRPQSGLGSAGTTFPPYFGP